MSLEPILLAFLSMGFSALLLYAAESILWSIFDPRRFLEAIAFIEESGARIVSLRRRGGRRAARKAALLDARLASHRRLVIRVSIARGVLYTIAYIGASGVMLKLFPRLYPAPAPIPLFTIPYRGGVWYTAVQAVLLSLLSLVFIYMAPPRLRTSG